MNDYEEGWDAGFAGAPTPAAQTTEDYQKGFVDGFGAYLTTERRAADDF